MVMTSRKNNHSAPIQPIQPLTSARNRPGVNGKYMDLSIQQTEQMAT